MECKQPAGSAQAAEWDFVGTRLLLCFALVMILVKETAMIELTEEQRQELAGPEPIAFNLQMHEEFFDDARFMYPMLENLGPDDWEDAANYDDKP
jgi:hypothetical protein